MKIIAIAMGDHPDLWYLHQLVQNPEMEVIVIRSRSNIKAKVEEIRRIACSPQPAGTIFQLQLQPYSILETKLTLGFKEAETNCRISHILGILY